MNEKCIRNHIVDRILFGFRKKDKGRNEVKDELRELLSQSTSSDTHTLPEERVCATCQQKLGYGVHRMLLVKDNVGTPFQLLYHDSSECFNLELIAEQMKLRGNTIVTKGHTVSSSSMKKFPDDARKALFGEDM